MDAFEIRMYNIIIFLKLFWKVVRLKLDQPDLFLCTSYIFYSKSLCKYQPTKIYQNLFVTCLFSGMWKNDDNDFWNIHLFFMKILLIISKITLNQNHLFTSNLHTYVHMCMHKCISIATIYNLLSTILDYLPSICNKRMTTHTAQ